MRNASGDEVENVCTVINDANFHEHEYSVLNATAHRRRERMNENGERYYRICRKFVIESESPDALRYRWQPLWHCAAQNPPTVSPHVCRSGSLLVGRIVYCTHLYRVSHRNAAAVRNVFGMDDDDGGAANLCWLFCRF